jgi:outer membrane protein insertion porin family
MNSREEDFEDAMFDPNAKGDNKLTLKEKEELKRQNILDQYNMKALNEVVNESASRPVSILRFNFLGADRKFRDNFLKKQLDPIISEINDNGKTLTLSKLLQKIDLVNFNLLKNDAISQMGCQISLPEQQPLNIFNPDLLNIIVNMQVIPVKKFFMKIGTNIGNGEGDGYIKLQWKNIFGGGESLDLDTNISSNEFKMRSSKSQYLINYSSPLLNSSNYRFNSILYHSSRLIDYTSYHNESIEGVTFKICTNNLPIENKFNHEISIENLIRSIDLKNSINSTYRNNSLMTDYFLFNSGYNFKSSITYSIIKDNRDTKYVFDKGYYMRFSNELSLFSQNKFIKTCFDYSKGYRISSNLLFNLNFKTGLICPISNDLIHPMDKFQLGGSNDIKGWLISGMGPKQMNLSIGGNYFHAIGLNLFTNLPYYKDSGFKFHLFSNIGKLTNHNQFNSNLSILKNNCVSAGFGISYSHPMAAFELNWAVPISTNANDNLRKGIQWGIGISFL